MCVEVISYCAIFTNAFLLLIVKQKDYYFIAFSILTLNVIALLIAYINDKLKEKVGFNCSSLLIIQTSHFRSQKSHMHYMSCHGMNSHRKKGCSFSLR